MDENQQAAMAMIRAMAPAFSAVPDSTLLVWVAMAETLMVCASKFGTDYPKALALFTLHIMTLMGAYKSEDEDIGSYSQRISSFTLSGEFSQTFSTVSGDSSSDLTATPWGNMYQMLLRKKGGGFGLITSGRGCRR